MEAKQPLYYHMLVGNIIFDLLLTLHGQIGSSNSSVTNNLPLIYTFSIDPSFLMYDSSLSFPVICVVLHKTMWCPSTYWCGAL